MQILEVGLVKFYRVHIFITEKLALQSTKSLHIL